MPHYSNSRRPCMKEEKTQTESDAKYSYWFIYLWKILKWQRKGRLMSIFRTKKVMFYLFDHCKLDFFSSKIRKTKEMLAVFLFLQRCWSRSRPIMHYARVQRKESHARLWYSSGVTRNGRTPFRWFSGNRRNWFTVHFTVSRTIASSFNRLSAWKASSKKQQVIFILKNAFFSQFSFGPLRCIAMVPWKNQIQRTLLYDTCHQSHLSLDVIRLH